MRETKYLYDQLKIKAEAYGHSSMELVKLKSTELSAKSAGKIALFSVVMVLSLFFLLFLSIGVAVWLGQMWNQMYTGFLAVAGFYLVVAIILFLFKGPLVLRPIENFVIRNILD